MLFLALKNVQIVKITPLQIPTQPIKNSPTAKFPISSHLGASSLPLNAIWNTLSNVARSSIQPKKQGNKKSSEGGDLQGKGRWVGQNLKKGGVRNIRGSSQNRGVRSPLPTMLKCSFKSSLEKNTKIFPCGVLLLYRIHETFIEVLLFQETSPALKNSWLCAWYNNMMAESLSFNI